MSIVIGGYASVSMLESLLTSLVRTDAVVILEGLTKLEFFRIDAPNIAMLTFYPSDWESGWMFNVDWELCWQRLRDEFASMPPFRVRLIADAPELLPKLDLTDWQTPTGKAVQPVQIRPLYCASTYLWGEYDRRSSGIHVWYEKIVPRTFAYPVKGAPNRVKIRTVYYALPKEDSEATIYRYIDIVESEV